MIQVNHLWIYLTFYWGGMMEHVVPCMLLHPIPYSGHILEYILLYLYVGISTLSPASRTIGYQVLDHRLVKLSSLFLDL